MTVPPYLAGIQDQRSAAIERVRRGFRWTAAEAVTAVAVIVGVVAHQIPGRSASVTGSNSAPAPITPSSSGSQASNGGSPLGGGSSLSPPVTAPTPTQRAPTAVSGGTGW